MIETTSIKVDNEKTNQDPIERYLPVYYTAATLKHKLETDNTLFPAQDALKYAEYFRSLSQKGKQILQAVIPSIFLDTGCRCTFEPRLTKGSDGAARQNSFDPLEPEGIVFRFAAPPTPGAEWTDEVSAFVRTPDVKIQRGVRDLITYIHEYSHELFETHVEKKDKQAVKQAFSQKYYFKDGRFDPKASSPHNTEMVSRALDEGFAILTETLGAEVLIKNSEDNNLTPLDVADIQKFLSARQRTLQITEPPAQLSEEESALWKYRVSAYREGYTIIRKLFEEQGLSGLKEILDALDPIKIAITERKSEEYQAVLADPTKLLEHFGRSTTKV